MDIRIGYNYIPTNQLIKNNGTSNSFQKLKLPNKDPFS